MFSDYLPKGISAETLPFLLKGLQQTLLLALVSILASLIIGLVIGMMRRSGGPVSRGFAVTFTEVFRNTPVLVQILWFYFALPVLTGVQMGPFLAAALGLSLNSGAFSAEIFRAGMQAVPRGQWEACKALGLSPVSLMRRIILPQAFRNMLPAFTNRWIEMIKLTSLASLIAYPELIYSAQQISNTWFNPVEVFSLVALIFMVLIIPASWGLRRLEAAMQRQG